ncbi:MAG: ribonuclease J, partial [Bacilli bacterium]
NKLVILCTGSQGEPLAALSRIADGSHNQVKLMPNDLVVFSSSPIPGNALSISRTINKLYLRGVEVYTNNMLSGVHTSGHAPLEELKLMLRLMKPKYFMPYHGEFRMLKKHADIAVECGIPRKNIFLLENGDILSIDKSEARKVGSLPIADIYVDGSRVGNVGGIVIRDRKIMSNDGILVIIANIDVNKKELLAKPTITTRGFVLVNENEELLNKIQGIAYDILKRKIKEDNINYQDLKNEIILELTPFIFAKTGRRPIILPVIMDIKR